MNQTKRTQQIKPRPQNYNTNTNRRPKRCLVCRKMFAFQKFNQHYEMCTKQQQKRIDEARLKQRNARNSTNYKQIQMPARKRQVQQKNPRQGTQQGNRFRIKSIMNEGQKSQYKSKSVLVNNSKKNEIKIQGNRPKVQENKIQPQIKVERNTQQVLMANESTQSVSIPQQSFRQQLQNNFREQVIPNSHQPAIVDRDQISPIRNISQTNNRRSQQEHDHSHEQRQANRQTLIEARIQQVPVRQQQGGYNIQALINNSNSIIQFIRGINILGQDQTMNTMLSQLQQLNLIAQQIVQLSALGHALGSTMGNVFAARIHQLQTVITNQIGIALIRGFNERLGAQFQGLIQMRPQRKEGFTEAQIQELFPQRVNFNRKECSICLEDMKPSDLIIELQCYHLFHPSCIKEWLISSRKCPMCRKVQQQVS